MRQQYVYVLRIPGTEHYKIGRTVNPKRRFTQMQLPAKPEVVGLFPCADASKTERALHDRFAKDRKHGEWFDLSRAQAAILNFWCGVLTA